MRHCTEPVPPVTDTALKTGRIESQTETDGQMMSCVGKSEVEDRKFLQFVFFVPIE